jgi:protein disulfide-isomerase
MNTKFILCVVAIGALIWYFSRDSGNVDNDRYEAALASAAATGKLVLLDFTGSDWCGWCQKLDAETFSQPAFHDFADSNLEMVVVDFPQNTPLPDEIRKQNSSLRRKFGVQGFPTLILVNSHGEEVARQRGYLPGGPKALEQWVENARKG